MLTPSQRWRGQSPRSSRSIAPHTCSQKGATPMRNKPPETTHWPSELSLTADGDGWNIFEVASSILNKEGDRPFQLQKIDNAGGIGRSPFDASSFETDQDAQLHVLKRAGQGYALHKLALEFLRRESPREYEEIIALRTCS
ncbi:hypothetical protein KRZ98_16910 [Sphingobium sp. AS12]|uniref:hypothetical protein n=1 Tax=Sphingobium sp. AS12 TaxID=2849495 RepID=UPI001C312843|nr:hypothetical protein [Sphingobium sp. AS12]MBV2149927.1 hypothetical protein [Sphingobium sp. AS12]